MSFFRRLIGRPAPPTSIAANQPLATANISQSLGDTPEARRRLERAYQIDPEDPATVVAFAEIAQTRQEQAVVIEMLEQARIRHPAHFEIVLNLGHAYAMLGRPDQAAEAFDAALRLRPGDARAWSNLGAVECRRGKYDKGIEALKRALEIERVSGLEANALPNLVIELRDAGRIDEALSICERNLPRVPGVDPEYALALTLLTAGRLTEGWSHHETRFMREPLASRRAVYRGPIWNGQDLRGKAVLLCHEQGVGDAIQFLRYAAVLKELGANVLFAPTTDMVRLAQTCSGLDRVLTHGDAAAFDYYIHLMSLPRVFDTCVATIPASVPYLKAHEADVQAWKARLSRSTELKVGIVWAGNPEHIKDRERSIPLELLAPLLTVPGVRFYSLQKGIAADEARTSSLPAPIDDIAGGCRDYADTAAAIMALDLVIAVDTSVAHLAGALGRPIWMLVARPADWRWGLDGEETAWYPSLRMFRQQQRGQWQPAIQAATLALKEAAENPEAFRHAFRVRSSAGGQPGPPSVFPFPAAKAWRASIPITTHGRHGIFRYFHQRDCMARAIANYGEWLEPQVELLATLIHPGSTVMEVDANYGLHAVPLARMVGPDGRLLLHESDPRLARLLGQNVAANRVSNSALLSDVTDLDGLRLTSLAVLKINGADSATSIVRRSTQSLWRMRPKILVTERLQELDEITASLRDLGYRCWRTRVPLYSASNLNRITDDIFNGEGVEVLLALPEETGEVPMRGEWVEINATNP